MLTKLIVGSATIVLGLFALAGITFAASNPAGTGQPGTPTVSCGEGNAVEQPKGLTTSGFLFATTKYAGSTDTPSANNAQSPHAVSQYDIACFQFTTNH